jgi:hypothetical protein
MSYNPGGPPEPISTCPSCDGPQWTVMGEQEHNDNCVPCPECAGHAIPGLQRATIRACTFCRGWTRVDLGPCPDCHGEKRAYVKTPDDYRGAACYECQRCDDHGQVPRQYAGPSKREHDERSGADESTPFE